MLKLGKTSKIIKSSSQEKQLPVKENLTKSRAHRESDKSTNDYCLNI